MLKILIKPWSYISIRPYLHQKLVVDFYLPLFLALITIGFTRYFVCNEALVFADNSALIKLGAFIQTLPGFYLAALSAIATFNKPDMDKYMFGTPLYMEIIDIGQIQLTRRRFLCVMFAFLTVQSFVFSISCIIFNSFNSDIFNHLLTFKEATYVTAGLIYFIFWQLMTVTLWGIYYLGERMHTPNP